MAPLSLTRQVYFWTRKVLDETGMPVPIRWNDDANANPATRKGGIPLVIDTLAGQPLFATVCGSGDASIAINWGQALFGGGGPQNLIVPAGFFPGWPQANGQADNFNPASIQGSAQPVAGLGVNFPDTPGSVQSATGYQGGQFYWEYQLAGYDLFSTSLGMGLQRAGGDLNFQFGGEFNASDANGGAIVNGGNLGNGFEVSVLANGATVLSDFLVAGEGATMGIAVAILTSVNFIPALFTSVKLPCVPCCVFEGRPI